LAQLQHEIEVYNFRSTIRGSEIRELAKIPLPKYQRNIYGLDVYASRSPSERRKTRELAKYYLSQGIRERRDYLIKNYGDKFTLLVESILAGDSTLACATEELLKSKMEALLWDKGRMQRKDANRLINSLISLYSKEHKIRTRSSLLDVNAIIGWYQSTSDNYREAIFDSLESQVNLKGLTIMDVGSGYGHVLFYGALTRQIKRLIGIELSKDRVTASKRVAQKLGTDNTEFIQCDAKDADFSRADAYIFFTSFPDSTLKKIKRNLSQQHGKLIVAYGPYQREYLDNGTGWTQKLSAFTTKDDCPINLYRIL